MRLIETIRKPVRESKLFLGLGIGMMAFCCGLALLMRRRAKRREAKEVSEPAAVETKHLRWG